MEQFQSFIGVISSVLSLIVTLGVVICTTIPNIRKKLLENFLQDQKVDNIEKEVLELKEMVKESQAESQVERKTLRNEIELGREANICLVRDRITHIYFKNLKNKTIKSYELENLTKLYALYTKLGGNSYVQTIYETITSDWEVVS